MLRIKSFIPGVIALILLMTLGSCNKKKNAIEGIPFQTEENGKWGLVKPNGEVIALKEFKQAPTVATDDRYWVMNSKGYYELYAVGEEQPVNDSEYRYVSLFQDGEAVVTKRDESVSVINKKGEIVADLAKVGKYTPDLFQYFVDGLMVFTANDKMGVCTTHGDIILEPIYGFINKPADGKIIVTDTIAMRSMAEGDSLKKGNTIIFDYKGNEILKLPRKKYDIVGDRFYGDYLAVGNYEEDTDNSDELEGFLTKFGIINIKGELIIKPSKKYRNIGEMSGEMFSYYDGEKYGVKTIKGEKVLAPKYTIVEFSGDHMIATLYPEDESFDFESIEANIYDKEGNAILPKKYHEIKIFGDNIFASQEEGKWVILDMKGEKVKEMPKIYAINYWNEGTYAVMSDKINIEKFVKNLDFSATSLGKLTFNTTVQQAIKIQNETFSYTTTNKPKAADYNYTDQLSIYRRVDGVDVTETIKYPNNLSHMNYRNEKVIDFWWGYTYYYHINKVPTGYVFTNSKPEMLKMEFNNYGVLRGKLKSLFKALCKRFDQLGTPLESNGAAALYQLPGGKYAMIYLESNSVTAKWGSLSSSQRNIYEYAGNKEDLSVMEEEGD
ncbi:MAG: WG repeat-containing protein [Muribaculaceae bacterium]|nr:WG repeat-containing protein [Muribaculaceae bacterium]